MTKLDSTDYSAAGTVTAEVEPEGWRPIETAPKDGTHVLVADASGWVQQCWFDGVWTYGEGPTDFMNEDRDPVTHWQPLPAPPKDEPR